MGTPQGRRLGYHTPEQVSNQDTPPVSETGNFSEDSFGLRDARPRGWAGLPIHPGMRCTPGDSERHGPSRRRAAPGGGGGPAARDESEPLPARRPATRRLRGLARGRARGGPFSLRGAGPTAMLGACMAPPRSPVALPHETWPRRPPEAAAAGPGPATSPGRPAGSPRPGPRAAARAPPRPRPTGPRPCGPRPARRRPGPSGCSRPGSRPPTPADANDEDSRFQQTS